MTNQQPNAFCAGLRKALDIVRDQDELRANVAAMLPRSEQHAYRCAAHYLANVLDAIADQLVDAGGFLGDAPEPEERAFVLDRNGAVMAVYQVDELDPDQYAERFADESGFEIDDSDGYIPNCSGDIRVEFRPDKDNPCHIWSGESFYFKAE